MAAIRNKGTVANIIKAGIELLALHFDADVGSMDERVASLLNLSARTLRNWKNSNEIPNTIDNTQFFGFIWFMLTDGRKDLAWLLTLLRATDVIWYEPISRNLIGSYLEQARLEGKTIPVSNREGFLDNLFEKAGQNPRIVRMSNEWCTAIPVQLEAVTEMGNTFYLIYFDEEIKLNEYCIYHKGVYIEPEFLKLESFDFERRQWKFVINSKLLDNHPEWDKATFWKLDYKNPV